MKFFVKVLCLSAITLTPGFASSRLVLEGVGLPTLYRGSSRILREIPKIDPSFFETAEETTKTEKAKELFPVLSTESSYNGKKRLTSRYGRNNNCSTFSNGQQRPQYEHCCRYN